MTETEEQTIVVEVAYALPERQRIIELTVPLGTTAMEAAKLSGIAEHFPEIDLETAKMGIFGQALGGKGADSPREYRLAAGDRVEIYRPLIADPKEARKRRAAKAKGLE